MLGNCDKTAAASNKWTQQMGDDHHKASMATNSSARVMEKPGQELLQLQQQPLPCPRCESSNTKFCYYNNYSLSQPRHFCKACKRYWTRGGTLRNVPVGGGCRKNKRVKRPITSSSAIDTTNNASPATSPNSSCPNSTTSNLISNPLNSQTATTNNINNHPLFFGNSCGDVMNLQFPRFNSSRVSSGFDLIQPQMNALGLGFSSSGFLSGEVDDNCYRNGFSSNNNNYSSMFGSSSSSTTPVIASLLSSTLRQQKFNAFQGMVPFEQIQMEGSEGGVVVAASKEVKVEGQKWNNNNNNGDGGGGSGGVCQNNQIDQHVSLSDAPLYWNNNNNNNTATGLGGWSDQVNNIGPSVTSLI